MTFRDRYYIALICFLFSVVWLMVARRLWRSPPARLPSESDNDNRETC